MSYIQNKYGYIYDKRKDINFSIVSLINYSYFTIYCNIFVISKKSSKFSTFFLQTGHLGFPASATELMWCTFHMIQHGPHVWLCKHGKRIVVLLRSQHIMHLLLFLSICRFCVFSISSIFFRRLNIAAHYDLCIPWFRTLLSRCLRPILNRRLMDHVVDFESPFSMNSISFVSV